MSNHAQHPDLRLSGTFIAPLFSPKGGIEGALLDVGDGIVQLTIEKEQPDLSRVLQNLAVRQSLVVDAVPAPPSHKGEAAHAVRSLKRVLAVDGVDITDAAKQSQRKVKGKAVSFHYARHGEANGIVLDSGDFVHLKPQGFAAARISVGDSVEAIGSATPLVTGKGFVVEADKINGMPVAAKPKTKPVR